MASLASRADFPRLQEMTYLATASIGLMPLPVQKASRAFEALVAEGGVAGFDEAAELQVFEGARTAAARLLGAEPDDVAIVTSATQAIDQFVWWLKPGSGENVVSADIEFPSSTFPWFRLAQETGVEVRLVPARQDPLPFGIEALARLVDNQTKAITISHLQYGTGHLLDPKALSDLAHAHGALLILDASQSLGMVPIDVKASGVDVLVSAGYKALCGPFGAAVCYVAPHLRERFRPPFVGWMSVDDAYALDAARMDLGPRAKTLEFSTMNYGAAVALGSAIAYVDALGVDRVLAHDRNLASRLMKGLTDLGAELLTPRRDSRRAGTVSARFPGRDFQKVASGLIRQNVFISPRFGAVRFSVHFFNDEGDIDRALAAVTDVLGTREREG